MGILELLGTMAAQVADFIARRPATNAAQVRFPAGDLIPVP